MSLNHLTGKPDVELNVKSLKIDNVPVTPGGGGGPSESGGSFTPNYTFPAGVTLGSGSEYYTQVGDEVRVYINRTINLTTPVNYCFLQFDLPVTTATTPTERWGTGLFRIGSTLFTGTGGAITGRLSLTFTATDNAAGSGVCNAMITYRLV